jgi:alkylation response protein AidB-like acyl-CoA dehydrogenase
MTSYQELQGFAKTNIKAAHIIQSDAEALEIATQLSQQFKQAAVERDANRNCRLLKSKAIASQVYGRLPYLNSMAVQVSSLTVAKVIALFSGADGSIGQFHKTIFMHWKYCAIQARKRKRNVSIKKLQGARFGNALAEFKTRTSAHKQTTLIPNENGYLIQGEKFYCTGSLFAHRIPTLVVDETGNEFWLLYNATVKA